MKIAIASDLHLEFADLEIKNQDQADVLVLAGDIMIAQDLHDHPETQENILPHIMGRRQHKAKIFRDFLKQVSSEFTHVIMIAGNHEFYHGKWIQSLDTLRDECAKFNNVHFMERDIFPFQDVVFVGGTLWTDMNRSDPLTLHAVQDFMHDYRMIRHDGLGYTKLRPAHTLARHRETLEYFRHIIDERKDQKIVVVSHMAPCSLSIHDMYKSEHLTNGAYYSDLSEFILDREQIKLWVHGHMHHAFDYMVGNTRVVCNPRGYVGYERGTQEVEPYYPQYVEV